MPFFELNIVLSLSLGGFDCKKNNFRSCFGVKNGELFYKSRKMSHIPDVWPVILCIMCFRIVQGVYIIYEYTTSYYGF